LYAGRVLSAWASRYLPAAGDAVTLPAAHGEVVARTAIDSFQTSVRAGKHYFVADEPTSVGGTDQGPTPYDLLAAALATCTTMTLKMYASFKKLNLRSTTVRVSHDKIHAEDCSDCESASGKIDEFRRELSFDGQLTEAEVARLLEIADRCPVHKTLHGEIKVRTTLA
jgi:putative redox protein